MVSSNEPMHACSGKKRKHEMGDNADCVEECSRPKEIQGEKDVMENDVNCVEEGARLIEIQGEKCEMKDNANCAEEGGRPKEIQGEKDEMEDNANCVEEGAEPKEIQGGMELEKTAQSVESMDRISHLPDHVIHQILSLLRNVKDAIRTSSFSKRWRSLWYSYGVLIFDEQKFAAGIEPEDGSNKESMFRDYVTDTLRTYLEKCSQIQKLLLHMTSYDLVDTPVVDSWLTFSFAANIKELDLHIGFKDSKRYTVPDIVFSSQTLTGLRISGCILRSCSNITLPHLQKLYLRKIHLAEHIVLNLISCCPSIEDLRFIQCSGLKYLFVYNLISLNRVEIHNCNQLKNVDICAPNLDTFWFSGKKSTPCKVSLELCKSLKKLTIEHPQVTRDFCENQYFKFPLLEKLDLCISDKMKSISIFNPCLKRLALKGCKKLSYAQIVAPNLVSFELKGESMPFVDFFPFCLTDAKLSFESKTEGRDVGLGHGNKLWFMMRPFISRFNPEGFKLVIHSNKNIIIHEDLNTVKYPPLPNLGFEIIKASACLEDILYGLLRTLHPVSVSVISSSDSKFPESVYEMIKIKDEDDPVCCRYNTSKNKCWRHFLKDVKFENWEEMLDVGEASEDVNTSTLYFWLQLSYTTMPCQMRNLGLSWNSHQPDVET